MSLASQETLTEAQRAFLVNRYVWSLPAKPTREHWEHVLRMSEPFVGKVELQGQKNQESTNRILSLVAAVRGDAFRELGFPCEAAEAYRTAHLIKPFAGIAGYYSQLVLDHAFDDHYETALAALDDATQTWGGRPWYQKVFGWTVLLMKHPIHTLKETLPHLRADPKRREALMQRLRHRAGTGHAELPDETEKDSRAAGSA
ncbi:MAG: hypothetical protein BroJett003_19150 [Planctomycetota bacterium]|nr:MAG: hypothetical protein BroJett003_19150 [Planctomycetota bacterium]